jgi:hypothetical protein
MDAGLLPMHGSAPTSWKTSSNCGTLALSFVRSPGVADVSMTGAAGSWLPWPKISPRKLPLPWPFPWPLSALTRDIAAQATSVTRHKSACLRLLPPLTAEGAMDACTARGTLFSPKPGRGFLPLQLLSVKCSRDAPSHTRRSQLTPPLTQPRNAPSRTRSDSLLLSNRQGTTLPNHAPDHHCTP